MLDKGIIGYTNPHKRDGEMSQEPLSTGWGDTPFPIPGTTYTPEFVQPSPWPDPMKPPLPPSPPPPAMTGWICPKCGAGVAPWARSCPCCAPPIKYDVTC